MQTEDFLARVVAPGSFTVIANKDPARAAGMAQRFFARDDLKGAAGYLRWASGKGQDAYFAVASFKDATQIGVDGLGRPKLGGERKQEA